MCKKKTSRTRSVLIRAVVGMAILLTIPLQVSAAELTYVETVQVSENESVFNVSVFPGKAGYSNDTVSGVFGDGTVVDYRFFTADPDTVWSWIDGGEGRVADITSPPAEHVAGPVNNSQNWPDVWIASDPDIDPADFTTNTQAGAQNITGTINISGLGTGVLYFIHGTYFNSFALTLTMSGPGQPDVQAEYAEDPPDTVNLGWVTSFTFSKAGAYSTITYTYTNTDIDGSRARFMGVIVDGGDPTRAQDPAPTHEQTDVSRDTGLSWSPGMFAAQHNVYVGDTYEGVDTATVPTVSGLDVNSFDPGRLAFGTTYYWRVDEVNGTPDKTVYKGNVWSFEVEPYAIAIPVDASKATASSFTGNNTPDMTVNGSGLDGGTHSEDSDTMWLSTPGDASPWLMVEFDQVQKLDHMLIWNSNSKSEVFIGWGIKDVNIETSLDGVAWTALAQPSEISKAPGQPGYDTPDVVDLGLAQARYVRLNILSNWGGFLKQYGVSEVQFYGLPVYARTPNPASGAADVLPDSVVTWRAGREAAQHTVYLSTDAEAVANGSADSVTPGTNSVALDSFGVALGETYYWRVDEVNEAETLSTWQGPVWDFSIVPSVTIDDFERYTNKSPNRPFQTWLDGFGYSADDFFPVDYPGNGTGAGIGHDIWSPGSPYFDGSIMETDRTIASSEQSMPLYYNNTGGTASETQRTFAAPQDWTVGGAQLLSIAFFGEAENTGTLYARINGTKVTYALEPAHIAAQTWKTWNIDLSVLGINLQSVTTLAIGVEGSGASGMLLIDDIVLRKKPAGPAETISLVNDFDSLPVGSSMDGVPGWEGWFGDAQWAGNITDTVAYSGTHALEIKGTRDDVVPHWPMVEHGVYEATVMQYVPTGTDGLMYFGPLSSYGASWDDTAWLGTLLSNCTTGFVYVDELDAGTRTQAPLLRDQWVPLKIVMNFDANACDFYYGDTLLGSLECPSAMGFDIWPDDDVDVLYYDDFSFQAQ
ncbi:MAG: discoidin domain-containing protein [Phycisphaerae bacterium]|nr:discoidin domain-containing protein [Phycisphaerae bacterium]